MVPSGSSFSGIGSSNDGRRTCRSRNFSKRDGGRGFGGGGRTVSGSTPGLTRCWPPRRLRTSLGGGASTTLDNAAGDSEQLFVAAASGLAVGGGCSLGGTQRSALAGGGVLRPFGEPLGELVLLGGVLGNVLGGGVLGGGGGSGVVDSLAGVAHGGPELLVLLVFLGLRAGGGGGGQMAFGGGGDGGERGGWCTTARVSPLRRPRTTTSPGESTRSKLEEPDDVGLMASGVAGKDVEGSGEGVLPALSAPPARCRWKRHASALCR